MRKPGTGSQSGVALVAALLLLMVVTALAVGLMYTVNTEQHLQRGDSSNNLAYYAAESAMEKMASDLSTLFAGNSSPNSAQITALGNAANQPALPGVIFPEYTFTVLSGNTQGTLTTGPNAGLMATWQNIELTVTAVRASGEQVRLRRDVQVALIPVFQFGAFSQSDMSFFPGSGLDFYGWVQTNGNLFLASGSTLIFHQQIRAAGDVIRDQLENGIQVSTAGENGEVQVPNTPGGCDGAPPPPIGTCPPLTLSPPDESAINGPTPANGGTGRSNSQWQAISQQTYNSMILSGSTGAQTLPFSNTDPTSPDPIQMIRQPPAGESVTSGVGLGRLYNQAQIRVLLADSPAELHGGLGDAGNIRLANYQNTGPDYRNGVSVGVPNGTCRHNNNCTYFAEGSVNADGPGGWPTAPPSNADAQNAHYPPVSPTAPDGNWSLIDGWLRVEVRRTDGSWVPVTQEWLELGFARGFLPPMALGSNAVNSNAILIFQELADRTGIGRPLEANLLSTGAAVSDGSQTNWYPINMYDVREGEFRQNGANYCRLGGVINLVEIDVGNLNRWLQGAIGTTGTQVDYTQQNGYVLYFSDRRGEIVKNGEYGFEDVVNPGSSQGNPNGVQDAGENFHLDKSFHSYGGQNLGLGFGLGAPQQPNVKVPDNNAPSPPELSCEIARKNWVSGARHGVRLVDAGLGNLPAPPGNNGGGFTLASENPAYILGNYNSSPAGFANGDGHVSSAVIADAVTLLSNSWRDQLSFNFPSSAGGRHALTTSYRVAVASGKNPDFPLAGVAGAASDFGTDGGIHNFFRLLEDWSGQRLSYRGSMVNPYYSQYATGVFKCCGTVYGPPTSRDYEFDTDFQDIKKMPPGTPNLRSVIDLGFQQIFR